MRKLFILVAAASVVVLLVTSASRAAGALDIWFIDVEGGQATLIVTPAGQSMLVDAGYSPKNWRGATPAVPDGRDPSRILAAIREAGLKRLDYVLITHFHPDHVGGVPEVAAKIPVGTFIDYGKPFTDDPSALGWYQNYLPTRSTGRHQIPRPGDRLALSGINATIVSVGGELIAKPLRGARGVNRACADLEDFVDDGTENQRSIGFMLEFGAFRFLDLGDLSGNTLTKLACPQDMVGQASVYLISHHGDYDTNVPALYAAVRPRVSIMNNSATRGGDPAAFHTLGRLSGLEGLWQLHRSENEGAANAPDGFIANVDNGMTGYSLRLTAFEDGSFTIVNARTGFTRNYAKE